MNRVKITINKENIDVKEARVIINWRGSVGYKFKTNTDEIILLYTLATENTIDSLVNNYGRNRFRRLSSNYNGTGIGLNLSKLKPSVQNKLYRSNFQIAVESDIDLINHYHFNNYYMSFPFNFFGGGLDADLYIPPEGIAIEKFSEPKPVISTGLRFMKKKISAELENDFIEYNEDPKLYEFGDTNSKYVENTFKQYTHRSQLNYFFNDKKKHGVTVISSLKGHIFRNETGYVNTHLSFYGNGMKYYSDNQEIPPLTIYVESYELLDDITFIPEPDKRDAKSIEYNSEKSLQEILTNGIYIKGTTLEHREIYDRNNFLIMLLLGIFSSAIISLLFQIVNGIRSNHKNPDLN